jgi:hypothetical protein
VDFFTNAGSALAAAVRSVQGKRLETVAGPTRLTRTSYEAQDVCFGFAGVYRTVHLDYAHVRQAGRSPRPHGQPWLRRFP